MVRRRLIILTRYLSNSFQINKYIKTIEFTQQLYTIHKNYKYTIPVFSHLNSNRTDSRDPGLLILILSIWTAKSIKPSFSARPRPRSGLSAGDVRTQTGKTRPAKLRPLNIARAPGGSRCAMLSGGPGTKGRGEGAQNEAREERSHEALSLHIMHHSEGAPAKKEDRASRRKT